MYARKGGKGKKRRCDREVVHFVVTLFYVFTLFSTIRHPTRSPLFFSHTDKVYIYKTSPFVQRVFFFFFFFYYFPYNFTIQILIVTIFFMVFYFLSFNFINFFSLFRFHVFTARFDKINWKKNKKKVFFVYNVAFDDVNFHFFFFLEIIQIISVK